MCIIWHVQTGRAAAQVTAADVRQHRLGPGHGPRITGVRVPCETPLLEHTGIVVLVATASRPVLLLLVPPVGGAAAGDTAAVAKVIVVQLFVLRGSPF